MITSVNYGAAASALLCNERIYQDSRVREKKEWLYRKEPRYRYRIPFFTAGGYDGCAAAAARSHFHPIKRRGTTALGS